MVPIAFIPTRHIKIAILKIWKGRFLQKMEKIKFILRVKPTTTNIADIHMELICQEKRQRKIYWKIKNEKN